MMSRSAIGAAPSPHQLLYHRSLQSAVGRSATSITTNSTGPFADSSLRPSCSCRAVNRAARSLGATPAAASGAAARTPPKETLDEPLVFGLTDATAKATAV